jgi:DNA polymerase III delta prime subunit
MTTVSSRLLETARRGELHHAIILHGPAPMPLRHLATRIAKTLNCLAGTTGDDCVSCQKIDRRTHPDVHFIEVSGDKTLISIEQIRGLVGEACLRPYEGRNKVFIIDPADGLSIAGSNSLLKTLEEPTRDTNFLLITRSPDLLLPTIRSRSQAIYVSEAARSLAGPFEALRVTEVALLESGDDLAAATLDRLHRYATRGEIAALLSLAAELSSHDQPKDAFALLATILCDAVALDPAGSFDPAKLSDIRGAIPRERLLAGAGAALTAIRWLTVNADVRLLAEGIVAELAAPST